MKYIKKILLALFVVALLSSLFVVWFQRQAISDWIMLRNYNPPVAVTQIADSTTMVGEGRRLFYVNRPIIASQIEFNEACSKENSIVLGCYISGKGIYIYNVTDNRLAGVKEVTAAHEMLHAAYDRLNSGERNRIDQLTNQAYTNVTSQRVRENVESYRKEDPSVVPNELHSILATEVKTLPPQLEEYYSRYFSNRQKIVEFADKYENEFNKRTAASLQLKNQLDEIKKTVDAEQAELQLQYNAIIAYRNRLNSLKNNRQFEEYNAEVDSFNQQVRTYNSSVQKVQANIDEYNRLVSKLEALQIEIKGLYETLDSRLQTL